MNPIPIAIFDFAALAQLLGGGIAKEDELFGLQWHGKAQTQAPGPRQRQRQRLDPFLGATFAP